MGFNPAAFGAGVGIVSDLIGMNADKKAAEFAATKNREAQDRDQALQREFAQMGIRWKVEDAIAAGLHPLAAIGTQTAAGIPSSHQTFVDNSRGNAIRSMGQSISRAVQSTETAHERRVQALQVENMQLQNDLLRQQLTTVGRPNNPPFPGNDLGITIPGQGDSSNTMIEQIPVRRTASVPGRPYSEFGHVADYGYVRTPYGLAIVPSKDAKERIEDQMLPEIMWSIRNGLIPNIPARRDRPSTKDYPIPEHLRKQGYDQWGWSYSLQQYVPRKGRSLIDRVFSNETIK